MFLISGGQLSPCNQRSPNRLKQTSLQINYLNVFNFQLFNDNFSNQNLYTKQNFVKCVDSLVLILFIWSFFFVVVVFLAGEPRS